MTLLNRFCLLFAISIYQPIKQANQPPNPNLSLNFAIITRIHSYNLHRNQAKTGICVFPKYLIMPIKLHLQHHFHVCYSSRSCPNSVFWTTSCLYMAYGLLNTLLLILEFCLIFTLRPTMKFPTLLLIMSCATTMVTRDSSFCWAGRRLWNITQNHWSRAFIPCITKLTWILVTLSLLTWLIKSPVSKTSGPIHTLFCTFSKQNSILNRVRTL